MPITTALPINVFDQEAFHQVDRVVTGLAFDIHNEFGRYLDEEHYQRELARRCDEAGFDVQLEFEMTASLDGFEKCYFADLLVDRGVIVETKAVSALTSAHKGQTLNYLFFCGLHHGTLLNFRTERVEHEFVSTRLTHETRQQYEIETAHWKPLSGDSNRLSESLSRCLAEWGAYLDPHLYRDAITQFLGGEDRVLRDIPILSNGLSIGTQKMHLISDDVAFAVTASIHHPAKVLDHRQRFLNHTPLKGLHWINLNHNQIELRTIERS